MNLPRFDRLPTEPAQASGRTPKFEGGAFPRRFGPCFALLAAAAGLQLWITAPEAAASSTRRGRPQQASTSSNVDATSKPGGKEGSESSAGLTEYEAKAQLLVRFAQMYVTWPESAFADKTSPFIVQVVGKDPFGKTLDEALLGKKVGEHPIKIVRVASVEGLEECQVLFVPRDLERRLDKVRELLGEKPVLIVSESVAAAKSGAHIGLYLERAKPRFAINNVAAKRVKLTISSEVLKLAKVVEGPDEKK